MPINYVLIDLENTQPENLEHLIGKPYKVFVFIGETQVRIPARFAVAMQNLGNGAKYIEMSGSGPNALDFHIAFYIGQLSAADPQGNFYIVSKDKGFDPLIKHVSELKPGSIKVRRIANLGALPTNGSSTLAKIPGKPDRVKSVVENLIQRGQSKPRTTKTLKNTIRSLFAKQLTDSELEGVMAELQKKKFIQIDKQKVTYTLPQPPAKPKPKATTPPNNVQQLLLVE